MIHLNETIPFEDRDESESKKQKILDATTINANLAWNLSKNITEHSTKTSQFNYCKIELDSSIDLILRTQVDNFSEIGGKIENIFVKALVDCGQTPNMDWQNKLDNQRSAVFVKELRNNNALLFRWVLQAILGQNDVFKLAFVAKNAVPNKKDNKYYLVGIESYDPSELASQIGLNVINGYGILKTIIQMIYNMPSYKLYHIVKDPSKSIIRIYGSN